MKDKPLPARLQELARILDEEGYMAEACSTGENSYILRKRNCVSCSVARNHPGVCCGGDAAFYTRLLGDVKITRQKSIFEGDNLCEFVIEG